jgi:ankyrin repeat protein
VALLLEAGANINDRDKEGKSALHYASIKGHVEVVKRLLQDKDIHINASDEQSCTALIYAAAHKHTRVIELIVDSGEWGGIGAELNVFALTGLNSVDGSTRDEVVRCILDRLNWRLDWDVEQEFSSASSDEQ